MTRRPAKGITYAVFEPGCERPRGAVAFEYADGDRA